MPDNTINVVDIVALLRTPAGWVSIAALVIFALVRVLKSERVPPPFDRIPPKARPVVALILGQAAAALQSHVGGVPWQQAAAGGIVAAALSVLGHDVFVEWLRGGREVAPTKEATDAPPKP